MAPGEIEGRSVFGSPIQGKDGKVRLGQKIDGFNPLETIEKIKEIKEEALINPLKDSLKQYSEFIYPALENLKNSAYDFKKQCQNLSGMIGSTLEGINVFEQFSAQEKGAAFHEFFDVTCTRNAIKAEYSLRVEQLAKCHTIGSTQNWPSLDARLDTLNPHFDAPSTFTITCDGISKNVTLRPENTLEQVKSLLSGDSFVCHIVKKNTNPQQYSLSLVSKKEAQIITMDGSMQARDILGFHPLPIVDPDDYKAKISFMGQTVIRERNKIDDLIPGCHLSLKKMCTEEMSFSIQNDPQKIIEAVKDFTQNYNKILSDLNTHSRTETVKGELKPAKDAYLYEERTSLLELQRTVTHVQLLNIPYKNRKITLKDLGITIQSEQNPDKSSIPLMELDVKALEKILKDDHDLVKTFFSTTTDSNSHDVRVWNAPIKGSCNFRMHLNKRGDSDYLVTLTSLDDAAKTATFSSKSTYIMGPKDTPFYGISFSYTKNVELHAEITTDIRIQHGVGSIMNDAMTKVTREHGVLNQIEKNLKRSEKRIEERIKGYEDEIARYDKQEMSKLSQLYEATQQASQIERLLESMNKAH